MTGLGEGKEPMQQKQFIIKGGMIIRGGTRVPALRFVRIVELGGEVYEASLHVLEDTAPSQSQVVEAESAATACE